MFSRVTPGGKKVTDYLREPFPKVLLLTDRDDGTVWQVTYNPEAGEYADGLGLVSLNDTIFPPALKEAAPYPAGDGPIMRHAASNSHVRLLVRGGYLGYEAVPIPLHDWTSLGNVRIYLRLRWENEYREIIFPEGWGSSPDELAWEVIS